MLFKERIGLSSGQIAIQRIKGIGWSTFVVQLEYNQGQAYKQISLGGCFGRILTVIPNTCHVGNPRSHVLNPVHEGITVLRKKKKKTQLIHLLDDPGKHSYDLKSQKSLVPPLSRSERHR